MQSVETEFCHTDLFPCHTGRSEVSIKLKCEFSALKYILNFFGFFCCDYALQPVGSLRSKWQSPCFNPKQPALKNSQPQKKFLHKSSQPYYICKFFPKQTQLKKFFPHCNKNYDFSFTFLLNFANFYSSSGENSLKFRKFLSNFRKRAKFPHAQSPILPPLWKIFPKFYKNLQI